MLNPFARRVVMRDGFPVLPGAFPLFGHLPLAYRGRPEADRLARDLGKIFWIHAGFGMWVLVCTGPDALELLRSKACGSEHLQEMSPIVSGQSLLSQDGALHRHMRTAMNGPFLPRGLGAGAAGRMSAGVFADLAGRWAGARRAKVLPEVQTVTLDVLFRILGVQTDNLEPWRRRYRDLLLANLNVKLRFPGSPAVRSERAKVWIDERLRGIVAEARRGPADAGLVAALAHARDEDDQPLTEQELIDNLRLLVLGGHETIAATLAWTTLRLAHHPELWDTLVEEAKRAEHIPESPEEARAFPFAEALFRETVRCHPAFGLITRKVIAPVELYGKSLPIGALVAVDLRGISRDPGLFSDPEAFLPSRWLGRKAPPSAMEISQFGTGPHFCVGYHLAWLEGVQFAVALARGLSAKGLRPVLRDASAMAPIYLPTEHPSPGATVDFR